MHIVSGAALFLFQGVAAPWLFGFVLSHFCRFRSPESRRAILIYGLGLWSGLTALLLDLGLRFVPGLPREVYAGSYFVLAAVLVGAGIFVARELWRRKDTAEQVKLKERFHFLSLLLIALLALVASFLIVQNLVMPLTANDPIVHTIIARILARDLSAAAYPFATPDPVTGFFLEGIHPLGFPASKALFMIVLNDLDTPWHKPMTAVFFIYLMLAVYEFTRRTFGRTEGVLAVAVLVTTPMIMHSVLAVHIDALRVYLFFTTLVVLAEYARSHETAWLVVGALTLTTCLHVHAGNVIILGFLGPLFLIVDRGPLLRRVVRGLSVALPGVILVSPQFITNYRIYGTLLTTKYGLESLHPQVFDDWLALQRGIGTLGHILINGALVPFTDVDWFSFGFWAALLGLVLLARRGRLLEPPILVIAGALAIYSALIAVAVVIGREEFYMNSRYALIMLPFACVFAGMALKFVAVSANEVSKIKYLEKNIKSNKPLLNSSKVIITIVLLLIAVISFYFIVFILFPPVVDKLQRFSYQVRRSSWILYSIMFRGSRITPERARNIATIGGQCLALLGIVVGTYLGRRRLGAVVNWAWQKLSYAGHVSKARCVSFLEKILGISISTGMSRDQLARGFLVVAIWYVPTAYYISVYAYGSLPIAALTASDPTRSDLEKVGLMKDVNSVAFLSVSSGLKSLEEAGGKEAGRTLTLRDSEVFLYGGGQMHSAYDPQTWPFLDDTDAFEAARRMRNRGYKYIYMPNYASPVMYKNGLGKLIYDATLTHIVFKSDRSVATLLELSEVPRNVKLDTVLDANISGPVQIEQAEMSTWPAGLERCPRFRHISQGALDTFIRNLAIFNDQTPCAALYGNDSSWLVLPPENAQNEYRLEIETASKGCVVLRSFHRLPVGSTGRQFRVGGESYTHYALEAGERAVLRFSRPPEATGLAFGLFGGCDAPASIRSARIVRVIDAVAPGSVDTLQ
jgi:hypothetical protein